MAEKETHLLLVWRNKQSKRFAPFAPQLMDDTLDGDVKQVQKAFGNELNQPVSSILKGLYAGSDELLVAIHGHTAERYVWWLMRHYEAVEIEVSKKQFEVWRANRHALMSLRQ